AHERLLTVRAHELIKDVPGLRFLGPAPEKKSGIVSFSLERPHPHDVAQLLDRDGVAIRAGHHCAKPLHKRLGMQSSSRASFYLYNTLEEVEIFSASLHRLVEFFTRTRKRSRRSSS
ncbi:MAG: aminotransferase class V-fold PLP-dependent enzyme, partial [bacterium]|nr:aminotransferase class V-fold PLP-dependent enzyme [bacterium]